jgi:hypothetical protein
METLGPSADGRLWADKVAETRKEQRKRHRNLNMNKYLSLN